MSIRILLIDDHPLFRKGVAQLVRADDELELAGEASDGTTGLALAAETDPDLILIDLNMKLVNGIETLRRLKAAGVRGRCVMLTVSDDERDVLDAMKAGADGYLLKDMEPEELCQRIKQSVAGTMVLDGSVAGLLAHALNAPPAATHTDLTEREREILGLLSDGRSNKEIARVLGISDATVKVHIKHVLSKLNMKSRLEAAVWALQNPQFRRATAHD
ncbi:two-component system response regulator NarL [Methyloversatilis sp. XJ19-49]|jgi:two-component system nitrate/nitrite response regulator NarL|uniref:two-component system response regulator NarL n=1 Tax=Methyloversatilis sp. XJ19-49 TaxID=2963429 RepID=UPI00211C5F45|nr:two-component system response regulator NarL [Methyloversatilis sp. XJ19-49]MCQ9378887.1 two-component system response regulator NarL [Methyloversatilis sp. XJ19-49]